MLVSDLDHTMVQNEDPRHTHLLAFNALHSKASPLLQVQAQEEAPLLTPHVLICSVGSEIFYLTPPPPSTSASTGSTSSGSGGPEGGGTQRQELREWAAAQLREAQAADMFALQRTSGNEATAAAASSSSSSSTAQQLQPMGLAHLHRALLARV
eukprot:XP_001692572.1 predicted protein [Chlamydomonas reinhardtii]